MPNSKWLVFIHGISTNGHLHGEALRRAVEGHEDWNIRCCRSNSVPSSKFLSIYRTARGISACAQSVVEEIEDLRSQSELTHLALVGASLGGLVAIAVAALLNAREEWRDVHFELFGALATPFLGVRTLLKRPLAVQWLLALTSTGRELLWWDQQGLLEQLSCNEFYAKGLSRFAKRIAYAPVWDDGTVAYPSSSLTGHFPTPSVLRTLTIHCPPIVVRERMVPAEIPHATQDDNPSQNSAATARNWSSTATTTTVLSRPCHSEVIQEGEDDEIPSKSSCDAKIPAFLLSTSEAPSHCVRVYNVMQNYLSLRWLLVDVNSDHKTVATLYQTPRSAGCEDDASCNHLVSCEVAKHLVSHL